MPSTDLRSKRPDQWARRQRVFALHRQAHDDAFGPEGQWRRAGEREPGLRERLCHAVPFLAAKGDGADAAHRLGNRIVRSARPRVCEFASMHALQLLLRHRDHLEPETVAFLEQYVALHVDDFHDHIHSFWGMNWNQVCIGTFTLLAGGEYLDRPKLVRAGLEEILFGKTYPFRVTGTVELAEESVFEVLRAPDNSLLRRRLSQVHWPCQRALLRSYQTDDYVLATATGWWMDGGQSEQFVFSGRRTTEVGDWANRTTAYVRCLINDREMAGHNTYPFSGGKGTGKQTKQEGHAFTAQRDDLVLFGCQPKRFERQGITRLRLAVVLPAASSGLPDEVWYGGQRLESFEASFEEGEIVEALNGFAARAGSEAATSFGAFREKTLAGRVIDQYYMCVRRLRYVEPGLQLSLEYGPNSLRYKQVATNGRQELPVRFAATGVDERRFPFFEDEVEVDGPEYADWFERIGKRKREYYRVV